MAGSLGRPTQLLLIASLKGMTTQKALIMWALGRKLRVETVTLRLPSPHPQPYYVTRVMKDPSTSSSLIFLRCHPATQDAICSLLS